MELLVKEYNGKNIILVSHGAVINSIIKAISDNSIKYWRDINKKYLREHYQMYREQVEG